MLQVIWDAGGHIWAAPAVGRMANARESQVTDCWAPDFERGFRMSSWAVPAPESLGSGQTAGQSSLPSDCGP
eukprot:CAMPEP_0174386428 /NCGR_PEP_ID=MMETSP0811_2-20130205/127271_1 /TAXON_ID=73025 ORGANISM="Eutreptiella gymnastica-like, Strain CCMP1594" /NCGR_SAMPLE_ID=MMETSP0811_2 /ASSEMBLY_ACC=CAM_ASM_000667 /LENGTH=71 /DNA_ID=CAMNT_0015541103 /DNA_START=333 /DNA_END=548 /DNA_ORIENTATION=+